MSDDINNGFTERHKARINKVLRRTGYILIIPVVLLIAGLLSLGFITDYIWMDTLGFAGIFTTILKSKIWLAAIGFLLFAVVTFFTLSWIRHTYLGHMDRSQLPPLLLERKKIIPIMVGIAALIGIFGSSITQGFGWERTLKFLNHASFGQPDPYFNLDISFYIFVLPFLKYIVYLLLGLAAFLLVVEAAAYSVFHIYRMSRSAQLHLGLTLGFIGLLLAALHMLEPFDTLLTNKVSLFQESVVHGLSYTDKVINIPKAYVLAAAALIGTVWMIVALVRGKLRGMVTPVAIYAGLLVAGQLASAAVQNFIVSPNEFSKERPFLEYNLSYTKDAYALNDIKEMQHPGNFSLTESMVKRNQKTIDNIRMNDARPLLDVYNQVQTFRTYYEFNDIDIDRYRIDGDYEQVFVGARELSMEDLPDQAQTWVNQNLRYTHGYGITMSHVNQVTPQGQPKYMVKNLPPEGVLDIRRPQIYFGEEPYQNVIVNSAVDEFDYPSGEKNVDTRFDADAGIPLNGINKLLFSLREGSFRMMISDQITDESKLLDTRNIMERVKRIAPFFTYDKDPYIVARDNGSMVWMIDAYVTAKRYPNAEPYKGEKNYIRNPIKVTVNAYTGDVNFYVVNPDDPLLKTYQRIFPDMFTTDIPDDIKSHFRYPEKLFTVQAKMYGTYHMSNLEVFYNREDAWQFPTEKYFNEDIVMEPYYMTMRLPEGKDEEFILMQPYTPKNRQNMISWIGVRNDGKNYGELFVYRFPKQKNIYGPQQIENRINQDGKISKQLNLWSQGGSKVIRGNLLVVPIEDTILYVEPVYIESSNATSLPEVKRVILAYGDHIVMERTFDDALDAILKKINPSSGDKQTGKDGDSIKDNNTEEKNNSSQPLTNAEEQLRDLSDLFDTYKKALSSGKWKKAAEIMEQIEGKLEEVK
ncbi:UPF0182 family protein [Virgibacillus siamensis]|uniref:UPF0182 protein GCM10009001_21290 n=1 Tax=Virgibacillus siamensis TaxID=480071 RepID=A0ABN1G4P1_9BACI